MGVQPEVDVGELLQTNTRLNLWDQLQVSLGHPTEMSLTGWTGQHHDTESLSSTVSHLQLEIATQNTAKQDFKKFFAFICFICVRVLALGSEDNSQDLVLPFHHVDSRDRTQVIRLGGIS